MDTEKIKQMGRDYFTANPPNPKYSPAFWCAWEAHIMETDGRGNEKGQQWREWVKAFLDGYSDAASKEGRAIELLGALLTGDYAEKVKAWDDVVAFLQEIGWKPNA